MEARVQKWGNNLAVCIPQNLASETGLAEDTLVDVDIANGHLVIRPLGRKRLSLDELLKGVTSENLHGEWDTGPAVGGEIL